MHEGRPTTNQAQQPDPQGGDGDGWMERILQPLGIRRFLAEHWGRSPLHLQGTPGKFADLFDVSDLSRYAVGDVGVGPSPRQPAPIRAAYVNKQGEDGEVFGPPFEIARRLFDSGMTLLFGKFDVNHPKLQRLVEEFARKLHLTRRVQVECFLSPDGSGFPWHFDEVHVVVLQIAGAKRWLLSREPAVVGPPFGMAASVLETPMGQAMASMGLQVGRPPKPDEADEYQLKVGDVLYLPPGRWHRACAQGQSCHLSITSRTMPFARMLRVILTLAAFQTTSWRQDLQQLQWQYHENGVMPPEFADVLGRCLQDAKGVLDSLSSEQLAQALRSVMLMPSSHAVIQRGVSQEIF